MGSRLHQDLLEVLQCSTQAGFNVDMILALDGMLTPSDAIR